MANGAISAKIDSLEFDGTYCYDPHMCLVSGDIYACVYEDTNTDIKLVTFDIDSSGNIGAAVVDSLVLGSGSGIIEPRIINNGNNYFTVMHANGTMKLMTIGIDNSGNIDAAITDSYTWDTGDSMGNLILVASNIVACVWTANATRFVNVMTIGVDDSGNIDSSQIDSLVIDDTNYGYYGNIINITGDTYCVPYACVVGANYTGKAAIFDIASDGTISNSATAYSTFDSGNCPSLLPEMIQISGSTYAIAYGGVDNDGFVATVTITSSSISSVIDSLEFDTSNGTHKSIVSLGDDMFAIAYQGADSDGYIATCTIDSGGTISSVLDTLEFNTTNGRTPYALRIGSTNILAIAYNGTDNDGWVEAYSVGITPTVTTQSCKDVVGATATGQGNITSLGSGGVTAHGHCWNTSINPTTADSSVDNGAASATGSFKSSITGLTPGTAYYTRAYATNGAGTSYGDNVYFIASTSRGGYIWKEGSNLRGHDENAVERTYLHTDDVDDTPVDGATTAPISSNWANDHVAAADPHTGYVLESLFDADTFLYASTDNTPAATSPANVWAALSGHAGAAVDINSQTLDNVQQLNITDPTELTISSGAVTATQGWHSIDTEGDAASDYLDTINGGTTGDILTITPNNSAREIVLTRDGNLRFKLAETIKDYAFSSPSGGSGTYYAGGYYSAPAADANLSEGSTTQTYGSANISYAAHAFLVAGGAGSVDAGSCSIVVSGTSINDTGTRTAADSETIVADITTMSQDDYYETSKKWLGTVTYTLTPAGATTYSADFNYGLAKYDDLGNQDFTITDFECVGRAGANDTGFNITLLLHSSTGWTYSAAAFAPGGTTICDMNTDHNTEVNLSNGLPFAYKRDNLSQAITGTASQGYVIRIVTGANNAVERMSIHVGSFVTPTYITLDSTDRARTFQYNGSKWVEF